MHAGFKRAAIFAHRYAAHRPQRRPEINQTIYQYGLLRPASHTVHDRRRWDAWQKRPPAKSRSPSTSILAVLVSGIWIAKIR